MTLADRFASEWVSILGVVHNTMPTAHMKTEFDKFVRIPDTRRVSTADDRQLLKAISIDEAIQAVHALNRHKAAEAD